MPRCQQAKKALRYKPVKCTGVQARAIARGFAIAASEGEYVIHGLAILPDHVHLVIARQAKHIDTIAAHLKAKATRRMSVENIHPLAQHASSNGRMPSPWARNYWCPFIRSGEHMCQAITYVECNPEKAGLRPQRWACVRPFPVFREA